MPKIAKFYLIKSSLSQQDLSGAELLACDLSAQLWRAGLKVLIACETEQQALDLDEALWARDPEQFVPHNLSGEVTNFATPIEISWRGKRNAQRRDVLINLQQTIPDYVSAFNQVIDFVPVDEQQKVIARERYKQYRQMGWQMEMVE
ncbi:DNA polymerase III subunit chi [Lonepinella koalarum]|uniref:DNA polymerase III chi subunit n=1 Tax=Lonepinella koalarum TaxID=53417 RepID=A0A4R1KTD9_9PAST|nr:DNA polymerase III subunit chi [Lonepinella koalarum]MDH2927440.1 DNA polymerase III subunit chi [Lonepinella koalarum]TCK68418.1 DNA polymerase III chi subunit [Lonepinella koalarum]TFJ89671.1 DNA polymerase III subunit chi [Lonepinella koalarum]TYG35482.1 DNA polymerase III subunit chi [Lonepinella koalarum]